MAADAEQEEIFSNTSPERTTGDGKSDFDDSKPPTTRASRILRHVDRILRKGRVEAKGIQPIPVENRKSTRYWNIFTVWCSMNTNILG
jgi:hypothetical protein